MIKHAINLILLAKIMANKKQGRATYKSNTTKVGCTSTGANGIRNGD